MIGAQLNYFFAIFCCAIYLGGLLPFIVIPLMMWLLLGRIQTI